jgi:hypothetical protein
MTKRQLFAFCFFQWCLLFETNAADAGSECDEVALLQRRQQTILPPTKQPLDQRLALVIPPPPMNFTRLNIMLSFESVVPTFGPDVSYIALIHAYPGEATSRALQKEALFCSGPNRTHKIQMQLLGDEMHVAYKSKLVWICDWPPEEKNEACFHLYLEDAGGEVLGNFSTCHNPNLLGQYGTTACVPAVFDDPRQPFHSSLFLPQWLDYHQLQGVEHFLVYTMTGTDSKVMELLRPYLLSGDATRVHIELPSHLKDQYRAGDYSSQTWIMNDCLYRMKYRSKWLMPSIDLDEYIPLPNSFYGNVSDFLDRMVGNYGHPEVVPARIGALSVGRFNFRYPETERELLISSIWRESTLAPLYPKYFVNPANVHTLFVHWPTSWVNGSVFLGIPASEFFLHHYRLYNKSVTNTSDESLLEQVPALTNNLLNQFGRSWSDIVYSLYPQGFPDQSSLKKVRLSSGASLMDLPKRKQAWINNFNAFSEVGILEPPRFD